MSSLNQTKENLWIFIGNEPVIISANEETGATLFKTVKGEVIESPQKLKLFPINSAHENWIIDRIFNLHPFKDDDPNKDHARHLYVTTTLGLLSYSEEGKPYELKGGDEVILNYSSNGCYEMVRHIPNEEYTDPQAEEEKKEKEEDVTPWVSLSLKKDELIVKLKGIGVYCKSSVTKKEVKQAILDMFANKADDLFSRGPFTLSNQDALAFFCETYKIPIPNLEAAPPPVIETREAPKEEFPFPEEEKSASTMQHEMKPESVPSKPEKEEPMAETTAPPVEMDYEAFLAGIMTKSLKWEKYDVIKEALQGKPSLKAIVDFLMNQTVDINEDNIGVLLWDMFQNEDKIKLIVEGSPKHGVCGLLASLEKQGVAKLC